METEQEILSIFRDEVGIVIRRGDGADKVVLSWTDYVANQWDEEYDNLAQALTRCALLLACEAADWKLCFDTTPEEHKSLHDVFTHTSLSN